MKENDLANLYLQTISKFIESHEMNQNEIWELAKTLAYMAQPRKSYQKLYNSPESRQERKELKEKQK